MKLGFGKAWAERRNVHTVLAYLGVHRLGEHRHIGLGGAVVTGGEVAGNRRHVYDRARLARHHLRQHRVRKLHRGCNQNVQHRLLVGSAALDERRIQTEARVVDEYFDFVFSDEVGESRDAFIGGEVCAEHLSFDGVLGG